MRRQEITYNSPNRLLLVRMFIVFSLAVTSPLLIQQSFAAGPTPKDTPIEVAKSIELIRQVGPEGAGFEEAQQAVLRLASNQQANVFDVLKGMRGASPEAKNWLASVASQLSERDKPSTAELLEFFADRKNDSEARYLVFRWIGERDDSQKQTLLDSATDDPSLPLRYLAIAKVLNRAEALTEENPAEAKTLLQVALDDGRNPTQLRAAADALSELGQKVDLSKQLGMFADWYMIGPFDNTDGEGFETEYEIERRFIADGAAAFEKGVSYPGKSGTVSWQPTNTSDSMGSLDLNPIFSNAKEAVCYAFCTFDSDQAGSADARLGSINANKVWVNGQLVTANEVYHAGSMVDQYIGKCELKAGENWVLVKVCQNNQTESWAQDFQFQFRVTDDTGKPLDLDITLPAVAK